MISSIILSVSVSNRLSLSLSLSLKVFCVDNISSPFSITAVSLDFNEFNDIKKREKKQFSLSFYPLFRQFFENHS
jgi:hypothetical protein